MAFSKENTMPPSSKVPKKSYSASKSVAKKGPFKTTTTKKVSRRFSIMSNSSSEDSSDAESSDSDSESESDDYDGDMYVKNKPVQVSNVVASSGSEDDYSSSSDDENIDFVQLTKQRRLKAMKAVKGLKKQANEKSSASPSASPMNSEGLLVENEESELDDDLVDAVIENEERKLDNLDTNLDDVNDRSNSSNVDLNDDFEDIDFDFSFDGQSKEPNPVNSQNAKEKDDRNVLDKLRDEDIGEVVDEESVSKEQIKSDKVEDNKIDIDVPKFNEKEINSDADYEFDNNDLIQTLLKDNDDLELQNMDNSDDDFDYLIANQHNIDHNSINKPNLKDTSIDSLNNTDDAYMMKEETQAMLEDFEKHPKQSYKNRRSSMYYQQLQNEYKDDVDDLDLDILDNFEQFLPKQQAMRRRSSILNQSLLSSDDEERKLNSDPKYTKRYRKKSVKGSMRKNTTGNSNAGNVHTKDIRKMLGISNTDSNFTSKFTSNAIADSDDDTKLLEYIFEEDSDSENMNGSVVDGDETDEDENLPKKSGNIVGSKHAKEILSSSKDQFRAPKLGTFITKKPFSVIDGFSTRFLQPLSDTHSLVQKAAALGKPESTNNANNSNNIALDELINISEFDEDYPNNEQKEDFEDFFGDKRIPLTAFRNKGLKNPANDISLTRRFSFTERNRRKSHHKLSKGKLKNAKLIGHSSHKHYKQSTQSQTLIPKPRNTPTDMSADPIDPNQVDEVLLIGLEPLELNETFISNPDFEISAPYNAPSSRRRKSMSRASKAKYRRASIAEAHAEGLRQTKNGLFDEQVMDDVEALLIDMCDAAEYQFIFGDEV